jgi:hypothetical protein
MAVNFRSWLDPFIILMALPGARAGMLWMLYLTGTTLSVPALMGAIMGIGAVDDGLGWLGRQRFTGHYHSIDELPRDRFVVRLKRLLLADLTPAGTHLVADNSERTLQLCLGRAVYIPLAVDAAIPRMPADWAQAARMLSPMSWA